jgi:hypothetical protein
MKPTTTTVKVCSTELNDSRSKGTVKDDCREAARESTTELRTGQVIANKGAAGVDEFEVETLAKDPSLREVWLLALAEELRTKTYRPSPVRRV